MQILYLAEGGVGAARATFGNAAASTLYGIDVDFSVRPAPGLTLNGGFELLHAKFDRSEEHTSELQSLMRISYAVFCLKKKTQKYRSNLTNTYYKTRHQIS